MRKIFYFIRMKERFGVETKIIENDNTINKRNWKKSGKGMRKYRKEILIFPTLSPFLILSRYFFLFLYPRIPRSPSLPLTLLSSLSLFLSKDPPRLVSRVDESARRGKIDPRWCPILTPTLALSASPGMPLQHPVSNPGHGSLPPLLAINRTCRLSFMHVYRRPATVVYVYVYIYTYIYI